MKSMRIAAAILAGATVLVASPAFAGSTVGNTINLGLVIEDECTIDTNDIDFGTTGIIDQDMDGTANIDIECTNRTPYSIALDAGTHAGTAGDVTTRRLKNAGTDYVNYQLYSDSFSTVWGHTVGSDTVDSASATGSGETVTIHARVPAKQNVAIGTYTDQVTATIWYADDAAN